jgi:hypothetical protein
VSVDELTKGKTCVLALFGTVVLVPEGSITVPVALARLKPTDGV